MNRLFVVVFFVFNTALTLAQNQTVFQLGNQDGRSSEFALSSEKYEQFLAQFSGEKSFYVGYSSIEKDWPYVLPGPLDSWAGGGYWAGYHPRHFPSIYFPLEAFSKEGESVLTFYFSGVHKAKDAIVRVEVNGHRSEHRLTGDDDVKLLQGKIDKGAERLFRISFSNSRLKKGMNQIRIGTVEGSWALFDCIRLESSANIRLAKATSTLIKDVRVADFEYQTAIGIRTQPVLIDMVQFGQGRNLSFRIDGLPEELRFVEAGESTQEINMPAIAKEAKAKNSVIRVYDGKQLIYSADIIRSTQPVHELCNYVDLLMGTSNSRWMFKPSPALPLSIVQIAPDNQDEIWKAGYEYGIENIMGFSHFCDWTMIGLLMQPTTGPLQVNPGRESFPDEGYRSRIDKSTEMGKVGHYSVFMTDTQIKAELTATRRAALQRYTFPKSKDARVMIDMFTPNEYPHNLTDAKITKVSDTEIEGYASYYNAFTGYSLQQEYTVHFVLQFSKPFTSLGGWKNEGVMPVEGYIGNWDRNHEFETASELFDNIQTIQGKGDLGVYANFNTAEGEVVLVRSGVSLVDLEGARKNLEQELTAPFGWDFEAVVRNARAIWNDYLGRIEIETDDYREKKKFYTNLYRAIAAKAIWSDADGRYRDENENVQQLADSQDAIVSGEYWNTFWDNQQLFNLVAPEISSTWAKSAISLYKNSGWFNTDPAGIEHSGVMVAMHVISQLQGAWQSGIRDFDMETAYQGLKKMMTTHPQRFAGGGTVGVEHLPAYMKYGYVPAGKGYVSNTLEYAYDDWSLAQMARSLGKEEDYQFFKNRSDNWKNIFDTESGFMRPKDVDGRWTEPFDPYHTPGFVEGNSFNYTWFVPHNPLALIDSMGQERFISRLNEAMEKSAKANFNAAGDNFSAFPINHGNQTSMEVSYLFNWAGTPWLTQKWNRAIQEQYYGTSPYDAYPGDEDLGQMSSWYIMSCLGLFQMDGGVAADATYELGSPRFKRMKVNFKGRYGRGESLTIEANNASKINMYIQEAQWNGKPLTNFLLPQSEVLKGGILRLKMGDEPNKNWGLIK